MTTFTPYPLLAADAGVLAAFGNPPRCYPFGEAPQGGAAPYAVWQLIAGTPENYLAERPDMDSLRYQFDTYALTAAQARSAANAIAYAMELAGHQVSHNPDERDAETRLYRVGFDFEFWASR